MFNLADVEFFVVWWRYSFLEEGHITSVTGAQISNTPRVCGSHNTLLIKNHKYKYRVGQRRKVTNFEMDTIQHQGKEYMSGRYNFGNDVLVFFLQYFLFYFRWSHGAVDDRTSCVCLTTVTWKITSLLQQLGVNFRRHFNIHRNQSVPSHKTIVRWVNAFRTQGTLLDRRPVGALRTPENVELVR